jgi:integrase
LPNAFGVRANPFASPKSARSVAHTVAALSSLYRFNQTRRSAHEAALLDFNPFAEVGRFLVKQETKTDRLFEPAVYARLLATAEALREVAETPAQRERAARWRWMTVALFNLWLRISELARLRMGDFRLRGGVWFASVHGKGRKVRAVEVTPAVLRELTTYRASLGLEALPQRHESAFAAVTSLRRGPGDCPALTPRALFGEIKALGNAAAEALEREAPAEESPEARVERAALAQRLRQISPHWFRHSGASEAINAQFPIADAAERLGHQDPAITVRLYYHADARRRLHALEAIEANRRGENQE